MSAAATSETVPPPTIAEERQRRLGTLVGDRWVIEAVIGSGGMATVFSAHDRDGAEAALKIVDRNVLEDDELMRGFHREVALHRDLDLPGIVQLLDDGTTDDGSPYFAMELLRGFNVEQLRRDTDRPIPVREAFMIAAEALDCIHALHDQRVVHRDIKPANLFVTHEGDVRVLDLGIALVGTANPSAPETGARLGTPAYMPPEQAVNATLGVDARSDVFAMGACLYAMLSGKRMRVADSLESEFVLAATTPPPSLARAAPHLPAQVIRAVDRAVAWNPNDRYAGADVMAQALRDTLGAIGDDGAHLTDQMRRESLRSAIAVFAQSDGAFTNAESLVAARRQVRLFFRTFAGLLGVVKRKGWEDPQADSLFSQTRAELEVVFDALGGALWWNLRPYSFEFAKESVWEPDSPFDDIPYFLFQSGFRNLRLLRGISDGELTALVNLLLLDPLHDLAPEDDLGTVFVEQRMQHVTATLLTSFDMSLLDEVEDLQAQLAELRDAVSDGIDDEREALGELLALSEDVGTAGAVEADSLDVRVKALQEAAWAFPAHAWTRDEVNDAVHTARNATDAIDQRTRHVLAVATLEADRNGDSDLVIDPLIERIASLTTGREARALTDLVYEVVAALEPDRRAQMIARLIDDDAMAMLLSRAVTDPELAADRRVQTLLTNAPGERFGTVVASFSRHADADIGALMAPWIAKHIGRNEAHVAEPLRGAGPVAAEHLLQCLSRLGGRGAAIAARAAGANPDDRVKLLGLRLRFQLNDEGTEAEVGRLLRTERPETRLAAIELIRECSHAQSATVVEQVVREERFDSLPLAERQRLLMLLFDLAPRVAEELALGLLPPRALMAEKSTDASRKLVAELLGTMSRSDAAIAALDREARRMLRNGKELRAVAETAARLIRERRGNA